MKNAFLIGLVFWTTSLAAQGSSNMNKLGEWNNVTYGTTYPFNDIWGYVDGSGNEYAIIGSIDSVHFVNVTDPANPVEIESFKGNNTSSWRDIKTFGQYAYASSEYNGEGLMIFDLSNLPSTVTKVYHSTTLFNESHNLFIDTTTGKLYAVGSANSSGMVVVDLNSSPANPTLLASPSLPGGYVHDIYVRNDTAYCSHGNNGLYVYDVSIPGTPVTLGTLTDYAESGYNHSGWLTADGNHYVFCDETHGTSVKIADISDLSEITVTDLFKSTLLAPSFTNSIAHNPFIIGDLVYLSYYHDGVVVFDISDPANVTNFAYYDTEPNNTNYSGYLGVWGVYPFLPSGNIIASDRRLGIQILEIAAAALPLELLRFEAEKVGSTTNLDWSTGWEPDDLIFEIERSSNGVNFETIGRIQGKGNEMNEKEYSFVDEAPLSGRNYYRLKQIEIEEMSYSNILSVDFEINSQFEVFPNILPKGQSIYINTENSPNSPATLTIVDMAGKLCLHKEIDSFPHSIGNLDLQKGIFLIQIQSGNHQYLERIIVY